MLLLLWWDRIIQEMRQWRCKIFHSARSEKCLFSKDVYRIFSFNENRVAANEPVLEK